MPKRKKFVIIDGNALLHRAWHALPPLTTRNGEMVNAVYGFASIVLNIIRELAPDYGAVAFDPPGGTFRHEKFKEYKATREKQPDELYAQIPLIKETAEHFGFRVLEEAGFEADDVIGTLAQLALQHNLETIIVTGDMDALQLVDEHTVVYTIKRGISDTITYDRAGVHEKHGFGPEKVVEYKALAGDASDNIPGVAGVGEKTAKELLSKFDSIDDIYAYLKKGGGEKIKESVAKKLLASKENAFLSRELATIERGVKLAFSLPELKMRPSNRAALLELFRRLEFRSLVSRAEEVLRGYAPREAEAQGSLFSSNASEPTAAFSIRKGYRLIASGSEARALALELSRVDAIAVDTETDSLGAITARMLGVSLSAKAGEAYYVTADSVDELRGIFENPNIKKYGHNIKYDIEVLHRAGFTLANIAFDTKIAAYLLYPAGRSNSLDDLAFTELSHEMVPIERLIGPRGKKQRSLADIPINHVADYAAEDADYTLRLAEKLGPKLLGENLANLFHTIEMPLVSVLVAMEEAGVKIDSDFLAHMSKKVGGDIRRAEKKIFKEAGGEFNVNSPLQLKEILFGRLGLSTAGIGKTKTGFSTAADQLEKLKDAHPIIPLIMEHRELAKLKSTYLDALPRLVNKETGRVHTHFNQTVASTGRLSSSDPNFQNIPIRTELGREIRKAFIAEPGNVLLSADYSQIELRIAADLSGDKRLIEIFKQGKDIHTSTAAFVHQIPESEVTPEIRRTAKEVNFGVLYGMGARGLSQRTGMPHARAKEFIDRYFESFSGVRSYIDNNIAQARERGFVETKFGRRLPLSDITSGVPQVRAASERLATNMPIQGTAADIIKMAMIAIHAGLRAVSPNARMLMQVHDELVFEAPAKDADRVSEFVRSTMEGVVALKVPVVVDIHGGKNWQEAH